MNKQTKVWLVLSILLSLTAIGSSCGGGGNNTTNTNANAGGAASGATTKYSGATGTISGVINYTGPAVTPRKIDTSADPVCGQANPNLTTEETVVTDGKLANVFVYVKEGSVEGGKKFAEYAWDTPTTPASLDQKGCQYSPHVMGVMVNQPISITNSDKTQHNIHPTPKRNPEWNKTQGIGQAPIVEKFAQAETLVPVKCNQHPWMKAYIGVLRHPLFAVSAANGTYEIKGVPPGTYTVAAWKEGGATGQETPMTVTVTANGTAKADFTFTGSATASGQPSLRMLPALEFPMLSRK
ncbi:MAG TPA: carboxypeptidase regulatory-like domain-containing protein [Pyrinomonadaceae bacterium]|nr:carboxypeptidase regulatory-like domain-containing protein [Pyrinomonadaceae bacterium]